MFWNGQVIHYQGFQFILYSQHTVHSIPIVHKKLLLEVFFMRFNSWCFFALVVSGCRRKGLVKCNDRKQWTSQTCRKLFPTQKLKVCTHVNPDCVSLTWASGYLAMCMPKSWETHEFSIIWLGIFFETGLSSNNKYHFTHLEYRPFLWSLPHQSLTLINIRKLIFHLCDPF